MTALALPFVFQCSFRSVFPNQYAPRLVFWGTGLSSILLARCLACVGELCWIAQISSGLRRVDADLHGATGFDSAVAATLPLLLTHTLHEPVEAFFVAPPT